MFGQRRFVAFDGVVCLDKKQFLEEKLGFVWTKFIILFFYTSKTRFNPRTRAGCDLCGISLSSPLLLFQSTHPCRVRPLLFKGDPHRLMVSIHAPVQGATDTALQPTGHTSVSIHAPVQGATKPPYSVHARYLFQSTHPCRVRQIQGSRHIYRSAVSIHAPVQGATVFSNIIQYIHTRFNPRTRAGCD